MKQKIYIVYLAWKKWCLYVYK